MKIFQLSIFPPQPIFFIELREGNMDPLTIMSPHKYVRKKTNLG